MWFINNTHLEFIEILKRCRVVCQPAMKYVPLVVQWVILYPSVIVISLETLERVLFLRLPIKCPLIS